jgi:hypothetical protein
MSKMTEQEEEGGRRAREAGEDPSQGGPVTHPLDASLAQGREERSSAASAPHADRLGG